MSQEQLLYSRQETHFVPKCSGNLHKDLCGRVMGIFISIVLFLNALSFVAGNPVPNVTINAWQYCYGCKETVNAYSRAAVAELNMLEKLPKKDTKVLDAVKVMDHLCDGAYFKTLGAFAKYSCIKVLDEHRVQFLEEFAGSTSIPNLSSKKNILDKKKKVCNLFWFGS